MGRAFQAEEPASAKVLRHRGAGTFKKLPRGHKLGIK